MYFPFCTEDSPCKFELEPVLDIYDPPGDRAEDVLMTKEGHAPSLVHMVRQAKIPARSEEVVLVTTDSKVLVKIGPLLLWDSIEVWTIATGINDAFLSRPFNVIVFNPINASLLLADCQQTGTALLPHLQAS